MTTDLVRDILEASEPPLIHIGYPKALSSWLQGVLFRPKYGFKTVMGPIQARMKLINPPPLEFSHRKVHKHFTRKRRRQGPVPRRVPVITSEGLVGNRSTGGHDAKLLADRIVECFGTARILVVVREQRSMLRSLYGNLVRGRGYPHSVAWLLDPISPNEVPQTTPAYLRYDALVAYYRQCFGAERVLALPYELFTEDPAEFVSRIASFAGGPAEGMDISQLPTDRIINPGSGLAAMNATRMVSKLVFKSPFDPRGLIRADRSGFRSWRMRTIRRLDRLIPDSVDRWLERRFADYVEKHTAGQFRESNRRLSEMIDIDLARYGYEI